MIWRTAEKGIGDTYIQKHRMHVEVEFYFKSASVATQIHTRNQPNDPQREIDDSLRQESAVSAAAAADEEGGVAPSGAGADEVGPPTTAEEAAGEPAAAAGEDERGAAI